MKKWGNTIEPQSSSSEQSDEEGLPKAERHVVMKVKNSDFLKLYLQKNQTHDRDREKAASIVHNLQLPKGSSF